jgi:hypothetical protein
VGDEELALLGCTPNHFHLMWHEVFVEHGFHVCHGFP